MEEAPAADYGLWHATRKPLSRSRRPTSTKAAAINPRARPGEPLALETRPPERKRSNSSPVVGHFNASPFHTFAPRGAFQTRQFRSGEKLFAEKPPPRTALSSQRMVSARCRRPATEGETSPKGSVVPRASCGRCLMSRVTTHWTRAGRFRDRPQRERERPRSPDWFTSSACFGGAHAARAPR